MSETFQHQEHGSPGGGPLRSRLQPGTPKGVLSGLVADSSNFIERMPLLTIILQGFAENCARRLAEICVVPPEMKLQSLASEASIEAVASEFTGGVSAFVQAVDWDSHLLFHADQSLVSLMTEMFLGSDGTQIPPPYTRTVSKIEARLMALLFERAGDALQQAFIPAASIRFDVETPAFEADVSAVARPNKPVVTAQFAVSVAGRTGAFTIVVSHATLAPLRAQLAHVPKEPEERRDDPSWTEHIKSELGKTHVTLTAMLDERTLTLDEIASLRVGQIIQLNTGPESCVRVECAGEPLLWCHLGKANGYYTLRVDGTIDRNKEFMEEIARG